MKYCNNCGNRLQDGQMFCGNCGNKIVNGNQSESNVRYTNNNQLKPPNKNGGKIAMIIITILVFLLLVAGLLFGAYMYFIDNGDSSSNDTNSSTQKSETSDSNNSGESPSIDIMSGSFNANFMNQDNRDGFEGVALGMSKSDIENKFGESESSVNIAGSSAEKHGNIAVHYDNDTVDRYFVIPDDVNYKQFTSYHGEETTKADEGGLIYDDNPDNNYSIKVYTDEYGDVTGLENVDQIQRNDSDSSEQENFSEGVSSKSEAEDAAINALAFADVDIWVHSVTDEVNEYRVNYGKENEDRAHRYVLVNKETGMTTGDTTGE